MIRLTNQQFKECLFSTKPLDHYNASLLAITIDIKDSPMDIYDKRMSLKMVREQRESFMKAVRRSEVAHCKFPE